MQSLKVEDTANQEEAETEIKGLKQRSRSHKEFMWEFRKVAGKLRDWLEQLFIHYFK